MEDIKMLAFDLGASSGRAILGIFNGNYIKTEEIHRFTNDPVTVNGRMYWDILRLFHEIKQGLVKCKNKGHIDISSIAIDTWGVSFGLLDGNGDLLFNPLHYRDNLAQVMAEKLYERVDPIELFDNTGLLPSNINTVFQLFALLEKKPEVIRNAASLLMTPDLLNYFLTGIKSREYTISSTTQLYDLKKRAWSDKLIEKIGIPKALFSRVVQPGTILGGILPEIKEELGLGNISVVSVAGHDTASAVAAVPATTERFAFISCGTWSVLGTELSDPIMNEKVLKADFSNEGGVNGTIRLLRNFTGFWVLQECKKAWEISGHDYSYDILKILAEEAQPFMAIIDPDNPLFFAPGDMLTKIRKYNMNTGQSVPNSVGEIVRCILESLAIKYRYVLEILESIVGYNFDFVHMIGGGVQNKLLCKFSSDAMNRRVIAGPVEATVFGNLIVQAMALGRIRNLSHAREIVKNSSEISIYEPVDVEKWDVVYEKAKKLYKNYNKI